MGNLCSGHARVMPCKTTGQPCVGAAQHELNVAQLALLKTKNLHLQWEICSTNSAISKQRIEAMEIVGIQDHRLRKAAKHNKTCPGQLGVR